MGITHLNTALAQPELHRSGSRADHMPDLREGEPRFVCRTA